MGTNGKGPAGHHSCLLKDPRRSKGKKGHENLLIGVLFLSFDHGTIFTNMYQIDVHRQPAIPNPGLDLNLVSLLHVQ